jgi:hypothetical protein
MSAKIRTAFVLIILTLTLALSACTLKVTGGNGCNVTACTNNPTPISVEFRP